MTAVQGVLSAAERSVRSVFVGNIPYEATEEQLKDIFSEVGPVVSFRLVYDRETGKPKGYGFCEYKDQETALSAMRNLNAFDLNGRPLRVDNAASEKSKEELKNLQASLGGPPVESPYGAEVEPERAPEAISKAVASLPPEQMFELMKQMKLCIQNNPGEARNMLLQNPQLAYALLQAQVIMKVVEPQVALSILHRQNPTMGPLGTGPQQLPPAQPQPQPMALQPQQQQQQQQQPVVGGPGMGWGPQQGGGLVGAPQGMGAGALPAPQQQGFPPEQGFNDAAFGGGRGPPVGPGRPALLGERPPVPEPLRTAPFDPRVMAPAPLAAPGRPGMVGPDPRLDPRGDRDLRVSMGDRDMRQPQPLEDQDLRTGGDPRFRAGAPFDPRSRPFAPQGPPGGPAPIGGRDDPRMGPGPARPGGNPVISAQDQEKAALIMQVLQLSDQQIALLPPDQRQSIMVLKEQIARSTQQ
ncbi:RNA recognition motif-containing protein [Ixodes scapularis]|uniref:RNA recognition motif-containing protein n=1 Tax=Ixodes scapularis TaxID=6945 RepID=B7P1L7_IXOSC|nr:RNA recognition motif-containing protein [Ixodes scapularis]|eukprot:XP_002433425.1 RNA recognition motif-containing protein [Ixodes scapularis]